MNITWHYLKKQERLFGLALIEVEFSKLLVDLNKLKNKFENDLLSFSNLQRHIVANTETAVDMGIVATKKLCETMNRNLIDFILSCFAHKTPIIYIF